MTILIFFGVLVLLILAHEFGHFAVAKKAGIRVDEFGIGFPPKIVGKKYGETEYTLNWLPIGGFVRIWGENPAEEHYEEGPGSERSFVRQSKAVQAIVLIAGVAMNVILAYVLYVAAFTIGIPTAVQSVDESASVHNVRLLISGVLPDAPAGEALRPSDEILGVRSDGRELTGEAVLNAQAVAEFIASSDSEVTFDILRRGEKISASLTPRTDVLPEEPGMRAAGISMALVGTERFPFHQALIAGAERTFVSLLEVLYGLSMFFGGIFTGESDFSQVTGPVGIVGLVGDAAALGFTWLLTFSAFISLNLAVINLLPFPALDGGRLLFVAIESVTRKTIKPTVATAINQIGFIALLVLMAIVTFQDVLNLL